MSSTPWLPLIGSNKAARMRLFCLPFAGGMSSTFRSWSPQLPPTVEVCPVELPGRGTRLSEPTFTRLLPLVEAVVKAISPYLDLPFSLFGHSMGALLGYEMTRLLSQSNLAGPIQLFAAGHNAPQVPNQSGAKYVLPDAQLVRYLKSLQGSPDAALEDVELMRLMLPIIRADLEASETYVYRETQPLSCPVTVFGGEEDPETTPDGLAAWQHQTRSRFCLRIFRGGHFFLNSARDLVLQEISRTIATAVP